MYDLAVHLRQCLALAVCALVATAVASVPAHAAPTSCKRTAPDLERVYRRLLIVDEHRGLTCSQGAAVASAVAPRYERGLPVRNYPPPPAGVPGGRRIPFDVATAAGEFTCRMTARGSDFVVATCNQGSELVRFESLDHAYLSHVDRSCAGSFNTGATKAPASSGFYRGVRAHRVGCPVALRVTRGYVRDLRGVASSLDHRVVSVDGFTCRTKVTDSRDDVSCSTGRKRVSFYGAR
jgi:hypothetical protein